MNLDLIRNTNLSSQIYGNTTSQSLVQSTGSLTRNAAGSFSTTPKSPAEFLAYAAGKHLLRPAITCAYALSENTFSVLRSIDMFLTNSLTLPGAGAAPTEVGTQVVSDFVHMKDILSPAIQSMVDNLGFQQTAKLSDQHYDQFDAVRTDLSKFLSTAVAGIGRLKNDVESKIETDLLGHQAQLRKAQSKVGVVDIKDFKQEQALVGFIQSNEVRDLQQDILAALQAFEDTAIKGYVDQNNPQTYLNTEILRAGATRLKDKFLPKLNQIEQTAVQIIRDHSVAQRKRNIESAVSAIQQANTRTNFNIKFVVSDENYTTWSLQMGDSTFAYSSGETEKALEKIRQARIKNPGTVVDPGVNQANKGQPVRVLPQVIAKGQPRHSAPDVKPQDNAPPLAPIKKESDIYKGVKVAVGFGLGAVALIVTAVASVFFSRGEKSQEFDEEMISQDDDIDVIADVDVSEDIDISKDIDVSEEIDVNEDVVVIKDVDLVDVIYEFDLIDLIIDRM
ncbi:MAG: hypothetical protein WCF65_09995 [Parachlamydiaceae bacterium]